MQKDNGDRAEAVRRMFANIAGKYDRMNRLMTFGRDQAWRRHVIARAGIPANGRMLDIGTGTGDIALAAKRMHPDTSVVAADFTVPMMRFGRRRQGGQSLWWCGADALRLPFADESFDAVTSGYLARNVTDIGRAFREQVRVVKPRGRIICLDTSPPPPSLFRPLVMFHLKVVIPLLGKLVAGDRSAYTYLPDSTRSFKSPDEIAGIMAGAGLRDVSYKRFMFGTIVVLSGKKGVKDSSEGKSTKD